MSTGFSLFAYDRRRCTALCNFSKQTEVQVNERERKVEIQKCEYWWKHRRSANQSFGETSREEQSKRNRNTQFIDRKTWAPLIIYDESIASCKQVSLLSQPPIHCLSIHSTYHGCDGFQFCTGTEGHCREQFVEFAVVMIGFPVAAQLLEESRRARRKDLLSAASVTWMRFSFCSRRLYFRWSSVNSDFNFESPGKLEFTWLAGAKLVFSCFCSIFFRSCKRTR